MAKHLPSVQTENIPPRPRSPMIKPNLAKDRSANFGPGGMTSMAQNLGVHTTLVPSPASIFLQRNMNPRFNGNTDFNPSHTAHLVSGDSSKATPENSSFFFQSNPYTLFGTATNQQSHLDRYRGTLYNKLAHNINGSKLSAEEKAAFKPSFFSSPSSPTTPTDASVAKDVQDVVRGQTAFVANVAKQTLATGLWVSFAIISSNLCYILMNIYRTTSGPPSLHQIAT